MVVNPRKDGIDHINVSKEARTALGKKLAAFNVRVPVPEYPKNLKEQLVKDLMPKVEADPELYAELQESSLRLWYYEVVDGKVVGFYQAEIWTDLRGQLHMDEELPDQGFIRNPCMEELDPNYVEPGLPRFIKYKKG